MACAFPGVFSTMCVGDRGRRDSVRRNLKSVEGNIKGICFDAVERVSTHEMREPQVQDRRDAIIRVSLAGLCGSDLHPFFGREAGLDPGTVMGHELVGTVVELGEDVKNFDTGDRVFAPFSTNCGQCYYCRAGLTSRCSVGQLFGWVQNGNGLHGCQSEFVRVPLADATLMKAPSGLSDVAALLLGDNFSTGYYCAEMAGVESGGVYAVIGCGTVGQLAIVAARAMGAQQLVAIDLIEERRLAAEALGAVACAPNDAKRLLDQMSDGRGADAVMELVGLPQAQALAYQLLRPGGTMSVIGCHCTPDFAFSPVDAYDKNLVYKTGRCPARYYMDRLTDRVAGNEFAIDSFVTHRFSVDDSQRAYDVFSKRLDGCVKAVIEF